MYMSWSGLRDRRLAELDLGEDIHIHNFIFQEQTAGIARRFAFAGHPANIFQDLTFMECI